MQKPISLPLIRPLLLSPLLLIPLLTLPAVATAAVPGAGAINQTVNTSTRFEGMGGAGVAAPWGSDTDHWANPALLAFRPGVQYLKFESRLAPGLADDVVLRNEELTIGAFGVTLLQANHPLDGNLLDMGTQTAVDENGNLLGTVQAYMQTRSWGFGVDGVVLLEQLLSLPDRPVSRYFTVAGGYVWSEFEDQLAPPWNFPEGMALTGSGMTTSKGVVARLNVLEASRGRGLFDNGLVGLRLGVAYGVSLLNDTDAYIERTGVEYAEPFPRMYLSGWSAHAEIPLAEGLRERLEDPVARLLAGTFDPLVSFTYVDQKQEPGIVWDPGTLSYRYRRDCSGQYDETGRGWEVGLGNVLYYRQGHHTARYGQVDDDTEGIGLNLQLGRIAGYRYDWAKVPQAAGLPKVERESWTVWVDPVALAAFLRK